MSPIPYIERRALEWRTSISYPPYKVHSQLGQNSGGADLAMFLPYSYHFFPFLEALSKNLVRVSPLLVSSPYSFCFCPLYHAPMILTIIGI
jgi:hypothetical protein